MKQKNNPKLWLWQADGNLLVQPIHKIVTPKLCELYMYKNDLLKVVPAENCENCYFYPCGYCKLKYLEKGKIHCDSDSKINFVLDD